MKNLNKFYSFLMTNLLILTFSSPHAFADKIKVKKVKGNQAVIESTIPLEEGQFYELQTDAVSQNVDYKKGVFVSRSNSMTLGGQFDFLKSDTFQKNKLALQGRYGWNFSNLEIGAFVDLASSDEGAGATTTVLGGGYFDYNLIPNRDPKKYIYGAFALVGVGSTTYPSSAAGGSVSTIQTNLGGFYSYFIGATSTALRGELYGIYQQVNTTAQQSTVTGLGLRGLLVFYF